MGHLENISQLSSGWQSFGDCLGSRKYTQTVTHQNHAGRRRLSTRTVPLCWTRQARERGDTCRGFARVTLVLFRRRALSEQCGAEQGIGRAFEKAVRRKPLARRTRALCNLNGARERC